MPQMPDFDFSKIKPITHLEGASAEDFGHQVPGLDMSHVDTGQNAVGAGDAANPVGPGGVIPSVVGTLGDQIAPIVHDPLSPDTGGRIGNLFMSIPQAIGDPIARGIGGEKAQTGFDSFLAYLSVLPDMSLLHMPETAKVNADLKAATAPEAIPPKAPITPADIQKSDPEAYAIMKSNGVFDQSANATAVPGVSGVPQHWEQAAAKINELLAKRAARIEALKTPEGAAAQVDVNQAADDSAAAAQTTLAQPTVADGSPEAQAAAIQADAAKAPPQVISAGSPSPAGRPVYSTVGHEPGADAGVDAGLAATRAQDAGAQSAFDLADVQRRKGATYAANRQAAEDQFAAGQHYEDVANRIGEDPASLVREQLGIPRDQFLQMPQDARERVVQAAQRQKAAQVPNQDVLRTSDDALAQPEPAPYDASSRPQQADRTVSQRPGENTAAPIQPTEAELDATGGQKPYARTATGTSDRPFVGEDKNMSPELNALFEQAAREKTAAARAASEEDLLKKWRDYDEANRRSQDRENDPRTRQRREEGEAYGNAKGTFSNTAKAGADGRYAVDKFGFVKSDKGGPIIFKDQKQAAKWILNKGHKTSPDQIFEIANHPGGKGFTAVERGRQEAPPKPGARPQEPAGPPKGLNGPKAEAPQAQAAKAPPPPTKKGKPFQGKEPKRDLTLNEFLASKGGVKDVGGELKAADLDKWHRGKWYPAGGTMGRLVREDGMHPDYAREAAEEAGYLKPGSTMSDLYDAMQEEARGNATLPHGATIDNSFDQTAHDDQMHASLAQDLSDLGVKNVDDIKDADLQKHLNDRLADLNADDVEGGKDVLAREQDMLDRVLTDEPNLADGLEELDNRSGDFNYGHDAGEGHTATEDAAPAAGGEAGDAFTRGAEETASGDTPSGEDQPGGEKPGTVTEPLDTADGVKQQGVLEGTERDQEQAAAAQAAEARRRVEANDAVKNQKMRAAAEQKPADEGLFNSQKDILDEAAKSIRDDDIRNTLYSNPLDPKVIKHLYGPVFEKLSGWTKAEVDSWVDEARHMQEILKETKGQHPIRPITDFFRTMVYSNDSVLQAISNRYREGGKPNAAVAAVRRMFYAEHGTKRGLGTGRTVPEAIEMHYRSTNLKVADLLQPIKKLGREASKSALDQIGKKLRSGLIDEKAADPINKAASGLRSILKDHLAYLKAAGIDIGEVKNYAPRVLAKDKIFADRKGFLKDAEALYRAEGDTAADAKFNAEAWHQRILDSDAGFNPDKNDFMQASNGASGTKYEKSRTFSTKADSMMSKWFIQNPAEFMPQYLLNTTKRAEFARAMGPELEVWKKLKQQMHDTGVADDIPRVVDAIQSAMGGLASGRWTHNGRVALNGTRTLAALTYLPKVLWSSLTDPLTASLRTGNVLDGLNSFILTARGLINDATKGAFGGEGWEHMTALAEDIGAINGASDDMVASQRFGEQSGKLSKTITTKFFRGTGINALTENQRIANTRIAQIFVRRLAKDVVNSGMRQKSARFMLGELGVDAGKVDDFSKWVMDRNGGMPGDDMLDGSPHAESYRTAALRFVNDTNIQAKAIERPKYANHPFGSLFYGLMSYQQAFQKNVLNRMGNLAMNALDPRSDMNALDRARMLAPIVVGIPTVVAGNILLNHIRDQVFNDPGKPDELKNRDPMQELMLAVSRAGLLGNADLPINLINGMKYSKSPAQALLGPEFGGLAQTMTDGIALFGKQNSDGTNTAERKFAGDVYNTIVAPAFYAGLTMLPGGLGKLAIAGGIFTGSLPATREGFVQATVGPPKWQTDQGGSGSGHPARPGRATRPTR